MLGLKMSYILDNMFLLILIIPSWILTSSADFPEWEIKQFLENFEPFMRPLYICPVSATKPLN